MITIKRLEECTLKQAITAWNSGFEGYYSDMTTTVDLFTTRLGMDGLSPRLSVVAFDGDTPIGLILNGIRTINGKKVSWNGGTGVATAYRRKGVARQLMRATLDIYQEEGVDLATLEAISQNEKAIALYQEFGYVIVDNLVHLIHRGGFQFDPFLRDSNSTSYYTVKKGIPQDVRKLSFYQDLETWQTHWNNVRDGESIIVLDSNQQEIGYALFKRTFNEDGKQVGINLYQCVAHADREDQESIIRTLLYLVYGNYQEEYVRYAVNLPKSNKLTYDLLLKAGFDTRVEQVYMMKNMK